MSKKYYILIALLNVLIACAVSVYWISIEIGMLKNEVSPFGLDDNHVVINVDNQREPGICSEDQDLLTEIYDVCAADSTLLLYTNFEYGVGLYDPQGSYAHEPLVSGSYFKPVDFQPGTAAVLVKTGSSHHRMIKNGGTIVDGALTPVRGVYDRRHPLFSSNQEYIYNYFSSVSLAGTYYFTEDSEAVKRIVSLLEKEGFTCDYATPPGILNSVDPIFTTSMLFIYFNCFLVYYILISRQSRVHAIQITFGATRGRIRARLMKEALLPITVGSLLGASGFFRAPYIDLIDLSPGGFTGAVAANIVCSALTLLAAFQLQRHWQGWEELV